MSDADDDGGSATLLRRHSCADIEGRALAPAREGRRRQERVERGGEVATIAFGEEGVDFERADVRQWWVLVPPSVPPPRPIGEGLRASREVRTAHCHRCSDGDIDLASRLPGVELHQPEPRHACEVCVARPHRGAVIVSDACNQKVHGAETFPRAARALDPPF